MEGIDTVESLINQLKEMEVRKELNDQLVSEGYSNDQLEWKE
jgi:hypothetical protein